jgi:hypothetical protein
MVRLNLSKAICKQFQKELFCPHDDNLLLGDIVLRVIKSKTNSPTGSEGIGLE